MRILVLGAYGLIGGEIVRTLQAADHQIVGLARSAETGRRLFPDTAWIGADLARMTTAEAWSAHLDGVDAVVNAAGVLQDGPRDDVAAIQRDAITALITACERRGVKRYVQISAVGARPEAETPFMATKGAADRALEASNLDWTILRPGLVLAPTAYGATMLLRMLAAVPFVTPMTDPDAPIQTVGVDAVARAVRRALESADLTKGSFDLVCDDSESLADIAGAFRAWLGYPPAKAVLKAPAPMAAAMTWLADRAGRLGWRSPMRTNAVKALRAGVTGDPEPWARVTGQRFKGAAETLARWPATMQERIFARVALVFPVALGLACVVWGLSGLIALFRIGDAAGVLRGEMGAMGAYGLVLLGVCLDLVIAVGLAFRRTCRRAAIASVAVAVGYLAAACVTRPDLWLDPLGPLLKILPSVGLGLFIAAFLEDR